jgi:formylglycine-generating enzyme required for sulfatase activity
MCQKVNLFMCCVAILSMTCLAHAGLIAHYSFDDPSDPGQDISGNGHHLTMTVPVTSIPQVSGNAIRLDASDTEAPHVSTSGMNYPTEKGFSVEYWFQIGSSSDQIGVRDYSPGVANGETFGLRYDPARAIADFFVRVDFSDSIIAEAPLSAKIGDWVHLCGVYDSDKDTINLFVNHVLVKQASMPGKMRTQIAPYLYINGSSHGTTSGTLDEVKLYDCAHACLKQIVGDINQDCIVNLLDFALLAENWLTCSNPFDPAFLVSDDSMILIGSGEYLEDGVTSVWVPGYSIGRYEVTNGEYCKYLNTDKADLHWDSRMNIQRTGSEGSYLYTPTSGFERIPVCFVSHDDAVAFTQWKSRVTGMDYHLPTKQQWQKAAAWNPTQKKFWTYGFQKDTADCPWGNANNCIRKTAPVGNYNGFNPNTNDARSFYGCYDMSGNVWEWTSNVSGENYILRGGWAGSEWVNCQTTAIVAYSPDYRNDALGFRVVVESDMVLVAAGEYWEDGDDKISVHVPEYYIGKYEVTNLNYCEFLNDRNRSSSDNWDSRMKIQRIGSEGNYQYIPMSGFETIPVCYIAYNDATAFTGWKSVTTGKNYHLPTKHQWQKAAAWDPTQHDPIQKKFWTYGFQSDSIDCSSANFNNCYPGFLPVGSFNGTGGKNKALSFYGCSDMAGNIWEWTTEPFVDSFGLRGGAWNNDESLCRTTHIENVGDVTVRGFNVGFRLVMEKKETYVPVNVIPLNIMPYSLVTDSSNNIYVGGPLGNNMDRFIKKLSPQGSLIREINMGVNDLGNLAFDPSGNLIVALHGQNQIVKYTSCLDPISDWEFDIHRPTGIGVLADGKLAIASNWMNTIYIRNSDGSELTSWSTDFPGGIAIGETGDIFVAHSQIGAVTRFTTEGAVVKTWGGMIHPVQIAADNKGFVYVVDYLGDCVKKFTENGDFVLQFGSSGSELGQLSQPLGIAVDASGIVYVAEFGNKRIQRFAPQVK